MERLRELEVLLNDHVISTKVEVRLEKNITIIIRSEVKNEYEGIRTVVVCFLAGMNSDEVINKSVEIYKQWLNTSQEKKLEFKPHQKIALVVKGDRVFDPIVEYIKQINRDNTY